MKNLDRLIAWRRKRLGDPAIPKGADEKWGLALSGGGIRSATFALGLMTAMARCKMLLRFDLMSTVSGGGYAGATIGRLFDRARTGDEARAVEAGLASDEANWTTWWLRANGRYLIPSGVLDMTLVIALYFRNLFAIHFELALVAAIIGCTLAGINIFIWTGLAIAGYSGGDDFFDAVRWLSPWLPVSWVALIPLVLAGAVQTAAFWCLPWVRRVGRFTWLYALVVLSFFALAALFFVFGYPRGQVGADLRRGLWFSILALTFCWLAGALCARRVLRKTLEQIHDESFAAANARSRLTQSLATTFRYGAFLIGLGVVERFAWYLAFEPTGIDTAAVGLTLAVIAAVLRAALPYASNMVAGRGSTGVLLAAGRILGYLLLFLLAAFWMALVYRAVLGAYFIGRDLAPFDALFVAAILLVPALVYVVVTGRNLDFLNLSSLHSFYRARLVRSYLGAANPRRFAATGPLPQGTLTPLPRDLQLGKLVSDVDEVHVDDDVPIDAYLPMRSGGPVHLITMCVNQTSDPRGGMFNEDRRGVPLTITSGGRIRECSESWARLRAGRPLSLGTYMAISGAAIAPGLGALTRGGISALAMFAGLRLGYWWSKERRAGNAPGAGQSLIGKTRRILDETLGNFQGTAGPDWFLTDGGHFENTGAYALIAERCRVIVVSDAGADPDFAFNDLENLVRKARIDLNASVTFMRPRRDEEIRLGGGVPSPSLAQFGTLNELASAHSNTSMALATVAYAESPDDPAILVYVKPNFFEGLPVDLVNFKAANPRFPQEPTADQFFSESQWESYFLLGQEMGKGLNCELLARIAKSPSTYFAEDSETTLDQARKRENGTSAQDAKDGGSQAEAISRIPARIARSTVRATIGLSAAVAIGVSAWQAIEAWRAANEKQVDSERQALASLTTLWSRTMRINDKPAEASHIQAMNDLATALLRTADSLCPTGDAGWFMNSHLALKIAADAVRECKRVDPDKKPYSCVVLEESVNKSVRPTVDNCLAELSGLIDFEPPPNYWGYNYTPDAPLKLMHPCDPLRLELWRRQEEQKASTKAQTVDPAPERMSDACVQGSAPLDLPQPEVWLDKVLDDTSRLVSKTRRLTSWALGGAMERRVGGSASLSSTSQPPTETPAPTPPSAVPELGTGAVGAGVGAGAGPAGSGAGAPEAKSPTTASPADAGFDEAAARNACSGMTVFIQVYDPDSRVAAREFREPWRALRASVPPIEDVTDTARRNGRPPPVPVIRPTIRYHRSDAFECAGFLWPAARRVLDLQTPDVTPEPLSARLNSSPKTIEVWLPPGTVVRPKAVGAAGGK